ATCVMYCLNQPAIQNLLQSIVFWNAKRVITKDILMRLNYLPILRRLEINKMLEYAESQQLTLTKNIFLQKSSFIWGRQQQEFLWQ
ncbi:MAG: hypothetical protein LBT09_06345, partial [Planctomycetaceae bacterium]|nr:hypothetical protein [Planctomycetaceae bacterium]